MSTNTEQYIFENTRTSHKRWESMVMYALHFALRDVELQSQYSVGTYLLDGYFPELNLAVEIDEKHHSMAKEADLIRENKIKEELGCEFFRIDVEKPVYAQVDELIQKVRSAQPKRWEILPKEKKPQNDGSYSNRKIQGLQDAGAFEFIGDLQVELESM
ncbi:AbaSI family restriction endonuclease, partial [Vibrio splendidus]